VNPARDVPLLRPVRAGGFPTWTVADIEKFEKRHPIGSKARRDAHQLMAIFGWRTIKLAEAYTGAAERKRLAGAAMHLLGTDGGQESLTFQPAGIPGEGKRGKKLRFFNA